MNRSVFARFLLPQTLRHLPPFCFGALSDFPINQFNFNFLHSFQLFTLNFNFLHCLGLIDVLSANEHAEIFVCILLARKQCIITKREDVRKLNFKCSLRDSVKKIIKNNSVFGIVS